LRKWRATLTLTSALLIPWLIVLSFTSRYFHVFWMSGKTPMRNGASLWDCIVEEVSLVAQMESEHLSVPLHLLIDINDRMRGKASSPRNTHVVVLTGSSVPFSNGRYIFPRIGNARSGSENPRFLTIFTLHSQIPNAKLNSKISRFPSTATEYAS
jgi:hypothetical protein